MLLTSKINIFTLIVVLIIGAMCVCMMLPANIMYVIQVEKKNVTHVPVAVRIIDAPRVIKNTGLSNIVEGLHSAIALAKNAEIRDKELEAQKAKELQDRANEAEAERVDDINNAQNETDAKSNFTVKDIKDMEKFVSRVMRSKFNTNINIDRDSWVKLVVNFLRDGSIDSIDILQTSKDVSDIFLIEVVRSINRNSPFNFEDKDYSKWRSLQLHVKIH